MGAQKLKPEQFEHFGNFILLEKLATGGMAEVWLARTQNNRGITKFVAVKKILPHFMADAQFVNMFLAEAAIVVNLSHANIVTIYEFGEVDGQIYLVMDYVEGRNLHQINTYLLQNGENLAQEHAIFVAKESAAALAYAHLAIDKSKGEPLNIVHRDVSPPNIMISFDGEVKLIDFGISKSGPQRSKTTQVGLKGKLGYLSPEQIDGQQADNKSDIFSLGVCMWEMATGEALFEGKTEFEVLNKVRECNIPLPSSRNSNVDVEFEKIIMRTLARDPEARFTSAEELHRELSLLLNKKAPAFSKSSVAQFMRVCFRSEVATLRTQLVAWSQPLQAVRALVEEKSKHIPLKLLFLFFLLIETVFIYSIEYQKVVLSSLPDKAKPIFLKYVGPFIDLHDEAPSNPVDKLHVLDSKMYVNIDGQYYEYSPSGIYIINGRKVYFKVQKHE